MALKVKDILVITIPVSYKAKVQDGYISQYSVWRRASQKVLNSVQDQRFSACVPHRPAPHYATVQWNDCLGWKQTRHNADIWLPGWVSI